MPAALQHRCKSLRYRFLQQRETLGFEWYLQGTSRPVGALVNIIRWLEQVDELGKVRYPVYYSTE